MTAATNTWTPIDLAAVLSQIETGELAGATPTLMPRTDGVPLLYPGELHQFAGEPESGKGWLALAETVRIIRSGDRVLYIDFEDCAPNVVGRLLALGAQVKDLGALVYVQPADALTPAALKRLIGDETFALAILDGMTEAYALLGLESESNADVPKFLGLLPRPIAATGAAVVLIDHVTKSREGRGRYAIGAQHKLAGIAVAYGVEVIEPPSRITPGKLKLTIAKDRHGHIRGHATAGVIALARIEPQDEGATVTVTLEPPDGVSTDGSFRPTVLMERASRAIEESPGLTARELRERISGSNSGAKDEAVRVLVREQFVEVRREGRGNRHYSLGAYRQLDDEVPTTQRASVPERASSVPGTLDSERASVPPPTGRSRSTTHSNGTQDGASVPEDLFAGAES
ncbi:MAG TPA: AAA family ATPase [Solirubrobacteraceae bacterium]|nr:AAA family ATPase [Solirubrobacteraceae bacterium]